jgi:hypothetical protein
VAEKAAVARQMTELVAPKLAPAVHATPEAQVDALMATIDDLAALAKDENANPRIRELVLRLGIFVGLEFEEGRWGKRPIRRLRRGVIAFGEDNLPVPIHGRSRADCPVPDAAGNGGTNHTHSAPACCRAPSAEPGSSAGEGTGNSHTDESNSGLEQTHQGTNVGVTRDVRSLMRQHLRKTAEKSAGLCPYPFPFQIWFDGDAVRARSASRRKRGGS